MELIPAIDLRNGRCVRLLQGDFERETRYDVDPAELAARYRALGARWLHVVDLDGAARGEPAHVELVARLRDSTGLAVQFGGGVRNKASLEAALAAADRVVVGSLAVTQPALVMEWLEELGAERLTLALDVRLDEHGTPHVATHGWTKASQVTLDDAVRRFAAAGLKHVLCTDIAKDGALTGPNVALYTACVERWPGISWQASGGVRDAADLAALAATGVAGAVSGKALLEGRLTAEELQPFLPGA